MRILIKPKNSQTGQFEIDAQEVVFMPVQGDEARNVMISQHTDSTELMVRCLHGALRVMPQTNNGITLKAQHWPDAEDMKPITAKTKRASSKAYQAERRKR